MDLKTKKVNNVFVVYLSGRLDINYASDIEIEINRIIKENPDSHILLDLSAVEYMSSSGIRVFVATTRILKEAKRKLKISGMSDAVKKIFSVVELMDLFDVHDTEAGALAAFGK
ncbi:MAG: STAS domain-containing protein [Spirochaetes bacterium]|nr:STAS domain-containing protein [Spirochaetota bacterium]